MIKLTQWPEIDKELQKKLNAIPISKRADHWDKKTNIVKSFKSKVRKRGLEIQNNRCAWCMLTVGTAGRRSVHRDHIAPKRKHPTWTFRSQNIVISCEFCNGFNVKKDLETVKVKSGSYAKCEFFLVHPYLDNPPDHLEFVSADSETKVLIKGLSDKGWWTIRELQLDAPGATIERAKDALYQKRLEELAAKDKKLFQDAVNNLGSR